MKDNQDIRMISQTTIRTFYRMGKTMMTYSLALWQIAGLILLTLLVVGILKRAVILIVSARSLRWSKLQQSLTDLTSLNLSNQNSSESGNETRGFTGYKLETFTQKRPIEDFYPSPGTFRDADGHVKPISDNSFGPSGFTPGGVSYMQVPQRGGALIDKGRKRFGRRK